ncbi:MAG: ABC transporter permease [Magnetococcales bacterium]|nr:ABC transporter permease [Magnetococcales bacterium]
MSDHPGIDPLEETLYTSDFNVIHPVAILRSVLRNFWKSRELAWLLIVRETKQRYRQSRFGLLWILITPLFSTLIFALLLHKKILNIETTDIPYPIYVMLGTMLWQIFSESITTPLKSFNSFVPIMIKINMYREAPILSGLVQVLFLMAMQLVLTGMLLAFFHGISPSILLVPLLILPLILFGTAIGILLVPLGILYKDVGEGTNVLLRIGFLVTPIAYPAPQEWPWSLLMTLNPVVPLLQGCRDWMAKGVMSDPFAYGMASGGALLLLMIALIFYHITIPVVLERLGA